MRLGFSLSLGGGSRPSLFIVLDLQEIDTSLLTQPEIRIPGSRVTSGYRPAASGGEAPLAWTIAASGDDWLLTFTDWPAAATQLATGDPDHILVPQVAESTLIDLSDGEETFTAVVVGTDATFTVVGGPYDGSYSVALADLEDGPVNLVGPVPSAVAEADDVLSITLGLWIGDPALVVAREIVRGASTVVQMGFADYTITADDVNDGLFLRETATDANGVRVVSVAVPIGYLGDVTLIDVTGTYYRVTTFTDDGTLIVPEAVTADYLIVAGGGGGGASDQRSGGGGGAGGVLTGSMAISASGYSITVGAGGLGATSTNSATNGWDSTALGLIADGGGRGGSRGFGDPEVSAAVGGSGGGGQSDGAAANLLGAAGTPGQGFAGADYNSAVSGLGGGGGGGAGGVGLQNTADVGGVGGPGLASSITATDVYSRGGGGGGCGGGAGGATRTGGAGGAGGGGAGGGNGTNLSLPGAAGAANTGGGGGGAGGGWGSPIKPEVVGGNGGNGVVIVRWEITEAEYLAGL